MRAEERQAKTEAGKAERLKNIRNLITFYCKQVKRNADEGEQLTSQQIRELAKYCQEFIKLEERGQA